jgi:hypothetical protein
MTPNAIPPYESIEDAAEHIAGFIMNDIVPQEIDYAIDEGWLKSEDYAAAVEMVQHKLNEWRLYGNR